MAEPVWRSKTAFWVLVGAFLVLSFVPSLMLVRSVERYLRFLSGWDPGVLKPTKVKRVPHRGPRDEEPAAAVHFVEFRLAAPKAKDVMLAGDFNQWRPEVPMRKGKDGVWETMLPLPAGRYSYLFHVDGVWTPDPKAPQGGEFGGRPASLREVP